MASEQNLNSYFMFEIKSLIGRMFFAHYPKPHHPIKLLNLGCGGYRPEGWVNADFFCFRKYGRPDWMVDLRFPVRCESNYWDGIFSEHTLEHLSPKHVTLLLKELYRILKPASWIRISVPDLEKYIVFYNGRPVHEEFTKKWNYPGDALQRLTQEFGHISLWDAFMLKRALTEAGFTRVQQTAYYQGTDLRLCIERKDREYESLYMEAQKPG